MKNSFKFSSLRAIGGGEQITYTSEIHTDNIAPTEAEIEAQLHAMDILFRKGFRKSEQRNIDDKDTLAEFADIRKAKVETYTKALKAEMMEKANAELTVKEAEKLSEKLSKKK